MGYQCCGGYRERPQRCSVNEASGPAGADERRLLGQHGPVNTLIATLKPQSNGPSYSNTVIGTLAVDGWAVTFSTFSTAMRGLCGAAARPGPSSLYQM